MLEALLAYHCAPAFAGIKPANLAACRKSHISDISGEILKLNNELNQKDIYIEILCECEKRALVMAYRKSVLEKHLKSRGSRAFLSRYGYPERGNAEELIEVLKTRMECDAFPHEIGVFLGYPLRDIHCFIKHRGDGCLMTGEWKVYHNVEEARKMFARFRACRNALVRQVTEKGRTLAQVFCAA